MSLNLTPQELRQRLRNLPQEVRDIYSSEEAADAIRDTAQKNGLTAGQLSDLESLVSQVLLGILSVGKFANLVRTNVSLDDEKTTAVVKEIEEHIFKPIRAALVTIAKSDKEQTPFIPEDVSSNTGGDRSWVPPGMTVQEEKDGPVQEAPHPYASGDPYKESVDEV